MQSNYLRNNTEFTFIFYVCFEVYSCSVCTNKYIINIRSVLFKLFCLEVICYQADKAVNNDIQKEENKSSITFQGSKTEKGLAVPPPPGGLKCPNYLCERLDGLRPEFCATVQC